MLQTKNTINESSASPLVSVIVPAYNCEEYVSQALESILSQDYTNLEILVSDDSSTDNTKAIIDSYDDKRIKCFHNCSNQGNVITTKKLFNEATGTFVTFQDADDWSHPKRISEQVELLLNNPSIGLCSTGFARVRQDEKLLFTVKPFLSHDQVLSEIQEEHHPTMCYATIMSFRCYIEQVGGIYRSYFKGIGGDDIDFLYRMLEKHNICNLDKIRYFYRTSEESVTNNVNLKQFDPLFVGPQLSYLLRKQRIETGTDAIQTNNVTELEYLKQSIRNKYNKSIHKAYISIAPRWASLQQRNNLIAITKDYISHHPFSLTTYLNISISFVMLFLGEKKYRVILSKLSFLKKMYKKITK